MYNLQREDLLWLSPQNYCISTYILQKDELFFFFSFNTRSYYSYIYISYEWENEDLDQRFIGLVILRTCRFGRETCAAYSLYILYDLSLYKYVIIKEFNWWEVGGGYYWRFYCLWSAWVGFMHFSWCVHR